MRFHRPHRGRRNPSSLGRSSSCGSYELADASKYLVDGEQFGFFLYRLDGSGSPIKDIGCESIEEDGRCPVHSSPITDTVGGPFALSSCTSSFTTDGVTFYNRVYSSGEDTTGYTWGACDSACGLKQPSECSETTEEADTTFYVSGTLTLSGDDIATAVTEDEDSLKAFIASTSAGLGSILSKLTSKLGNKYETTTIEFQVKCPTKKEARKAKRLINRSIEEDDHIQDFKDMDIEITSYKSALPTTINKESIDFGQGHSTGVASLHHNATEANAMIREQEEEAEKVAKELAEAQAAAATETPAAAADAQKIVDVDLEKIGIINPANYTGKQQYTIDGLKCEAWDSTRAQKWSYTAEKFPEGNLGSHNYCRNPAGDNMLWCITSEKSKATNSYWNWCVPKGCEPKGDGTTVSWCHGVDYRGDQGTTRYGFKCKDWNNTKTHPSKFPDSGLEGQTCRSAIQAYGYEKPWCWVQENIHNYWWDYCNLESVTVD